MVIEKCSGKNTEQIEWIVSNKMAVKRKQGKGHHGFHWSDDKMPTNYYCCVSLSFSTIKYETKQTQKLFEKKK